MATISMKEHLSKEQVERLSMIAYERNLESGEYEVVLEAMKNSGYHPSGYGAWDIKVGRDKEGAYVKWNRGSTCD